MSVHIVGLYSKMKMTMNLNYRPGVLLEINHEAVLLEINHEAVLLEAHHEAVLQAVHHEAALQAAHHEAVLQAVHHEAALQAAHHEAHQEVPVAVHLLVGQKAVPRRVPSVALQNE
jgi:hypothetical protein